MTARDAVAAWVAFGCAVAAFASLEDGFRSPPDSAKPHVWFHLMNGNATKAGITRDFEALAQAGIGGVQMFDAGCGIPPGGLDFNSPAWFDLIRHAAGEARRLGLEIGLPTCSGWSCSGGPWNSPENAMKEVTWRRVTVTGPIRFRARLPRETEDHGFYADIGVFAFPSPTGEDATFPGVVTTIERDGFVFTAEKPFEACGFTYRLKFPWAWNAEAEMALFVSDDGRTFRPFETFRIPLARAGMNDQSVRFHTFPHRVTMRALRAKVVRAPMAVTVDAAAPSGRIGLSGLGAKTFAFRQEVDIDSFATTPDQVVRRDAVRDLTALMEPDGTLAWDVPSGDWTILRVGYRCNGRCNHPATACGRGLEVDKLSAEALDNHFERYVGRLCRMLGPLAGNVSAGLNNILVDSYEVGSQNWTQKMEAAFETRCGYSLRAFLPVFAGFVVDDVGTTERFLEDFRRVVADLFAENYAGALARKCHQYGLRLSIEPYGNCPSDNLRYGAFCDIPMGEFWSHADDPYARGCGNAKFAASLAHVWGRKFCGAEAFTADPSQGAGRWLTTPFSIKAQGDSVYAHGVNRFIYHRWTHQPWPDDRYLPGMTMGRWGMHLDRTQTWWPFAGAVFAYQTRCQYLLQQGTFRADVLFFAGEQVPNQGGNTDRDGAVPLAYRLPAGYDYDVCAVDALAALRVVGGRLVAPGGVSYRLLVLPVATACSSELLRCVTKLRDAGAAIVWPKKPVRAIGLKEGPAGDARVRALADALWAKGVMTCTPAEALVRLGIAPDVTVVSNGAWAVPAIEWIHRGDAEAEWYFAALPNRNEMTVELSFRQTGRIPEIWDAEHGTCAPAEIWREENGHTFVTVPFTTCGSKFVVFRHPAGMMRAGRGGSGRVTTTVPVAGAWAVRFPHGFLPNPLARGAEEKVVFPMLISWSEHADRDVRYFSGIATYEKTLAGGAVAKARSHSNARVFLDLGEVRHFAEVTVNGKTFPVLWKPPFRLDITEALGSGAADIALSIRVANLWANRLIGDDRECADDCLWNGGVVNGVKEMSVREIPAWVREGKKSPTGRCTWTTWKHWDKNDDLLPSGILGPVVLGVSVPRGETGGETR